MKHRSEIVERFNQEIKKPLPANDLFKIGKSRGWMDALEWVLDYGK